MTDRKPRPGTTPIPGADTPKITRARLSKQVADARRALREETTTASKMPSSELADYVEQRADLAVTTLEHVRLLEAARRLRSAGMPT